MAGVALIGYLLFAVVAIKDGTFDWPRYTSLVGVITLACAGSWALSAVSHLGYQRSRQRSWRVPAQKRRRGPREHPDTSAVTRLWPTAPIPKGRLLPFAALAAGAFLAGLSGVFLVDWFNSRSGGASGVTVTRGGEGSTARDHEGELRSTDAASNVGKEQVYSLCRSAAQRFCVVDGDTFWHAGVKIRIADIDTPEISEPRCRSEEALGHRAKERLLALVNEGPFEIVRSGGRDEDVFGRKLRVLIRGGRSLSTILVEEGLARHWTERRESWCF